MSGARAVEPLGIYVRQREQIDALRYSESRRFERIEQTSACLADGEIQVIVENDVHSPCSGVGSWPTNAHFLRVVRVLCLTPFSSRSLAYVCMSKNARPHECGRL